jgi:hypothetical protein
LLITGTILAILLLLLPVAAISAESGGRPAGGKDAPSGPPQELKDAFKTLQGIGNRIGEEIPKAVNATISAIKKAADRASGKAPSKNQPKKDGK